MGPHPQLGVRSPFLSSDRDPLDGQRFRATGITDQAARDDFGLAEPALSVGARKNSPSADVAAPARGTRSNIDRAAGPPVAARGTSVGTPKVSSSCRPRTARAEPTGRVTGREYQSLP